ncbi:LysR family transcriptional regulator [Brucella pseudogrignonensis]|uniref:DNA-binding transcriptional LysR family regulator n=1 Tax=Brucella pseudogrignonensis TaxID=419475 RepID=A0ABU1MDF4_9HYPH|nr:LysR family transcriptional regulator [Brucella pseudogrignonensis]MDR6433835.1 DNA-binding transcriptional LysR family regulator [Brucella pseudogrignonensis]
MKFDLIDLRIFVSAIEHGSLTAAANQNNIVVAAVSARLKKLEESFNLKLFDRTGRGIRPTLAGEMFARNARKLIDDARRAQTALDDFADGRGGHVKLLSNTNMLAEHLPHALGTFLAAHPDVTVSIEDKPSLEVVSLLRNGEADIGIVASSADMSGLEQWRFVPDKLVLVTPPEHPLSASQVNYSRVLDFKLIGLPKQTALMQFLGRLANELGRTVDYRMRAENFEAACRMVEGGAGIAIVPQSAALRYGSYMALSIIDINESWADRELYLCTRNEAQLPGYSRRLFNHLREYAANPS